MYLHLSLVGVPAGPVWEACKGTEHVNMYFSCCNSLHLRCFSCAQCVCVCVVPEEVLVCYGVHLEVCS